ncbi:ATP-binding protein [Streptomyces sp. 891-h]|uniref:ATP-binding protein n=1 Tax=Streptomyces sp. 891-h TaxID=2720714 RepID=UPI001FA97516|nr:ATP-binding protein [Streptomyces sp. 891-h]UNZ21352.1 ATP-binding protein [Streptomyces sp. 891-h]
MTNRQFLTVLTRGDRTECAELQLESEAAAVGDARRFVRQQLAAWWLPGDDDFADRVVLTTSELVTNAVVHARTRPVGESEHVGVTLAFAAGIALGVLVTDNSDAAPLPAIQLSTNAPGGRGLALVSAMSDDWITVPRKCTGDTTGKGVWAFFTCPKSKGRLSQPA